MKYFISALAGILWPPLAPVVDRSQTDPRADQTWWLALCVLLVIPFTAVWHHAIFYSPRCMLNDFGPDYTPEVVRHWLSRDPSLPWAIITAGIFYFAGVRSRRVRLLAAPIFLACLPLSIWIWDIPFSGRIVCYTGHDKRVLPIIGIMMRTRYLYLLAALLYVVLLVAELARLSPGRTEKAPLPAK